MGEAGSDAGSRRIAHPTHDDRDRISGPPGSEYRRRPPGHDHIDRNADQLGRKRGVKFRLPSCPTELEPEVFTFDIPKVVQPLPQAFEAWPWRIPENAYTRNFAGNRIGGGSAR